MELSAKEQTLNFNVGVIEKECGIKFNGHTFEEKEEFVKEYRKQNAAFTQKFMEDMRREYMRKKD